MIVAAIFALGALGATPQTHGACNAADRAKNDEIVSHLQACFKQLDGNDSVSGVQACIETKGFSKSCSGCIADLGMCEAERCQDECANGAYTKSCEKCVNDGGDKCK